MEKNNEKSDKDIYSLLLELINDLRGSIDIYELKNYMLGLFFYKYLSVYLLDYITNIPSNEETYFKTSGKSDILYNLKQKILNEDEVGYYIAPAYLYSSLVKMIINHTFHIQVLQEALRSIETLHFNNKSKLNIKNLFNDIDLSLTKLEKNEIERTDIIVKIMIGIDKIDFDIESRLAGDIYEYMINYFAICTRKPLVDFYTPSPVAKLLAKLITIDKESLKNVYDPACGCGSLLLNAGKEVKDIERYYGQDINSTICNLTVMNLIIHGVPLKKIDIKNADTLVKPEHLDIRFDAIVCNPPYSMKWGGSSKLNGYERFHGYGPLPPKARADYAFILHMIYQLSDNGTMAVVLPHGVLFRGSTEGEIRKQLIERYNYLDAVIGLPANIFYGTSIPTCILVFKKNRKYTNEILFIDASKEFEAEKNQNRLRNQDIDRIINVYSNWQEVKRYSSVINIKIIRENAFNLNIPRFIDTFEEEEVNANDLIDKLDNINNQIMEVNEELSFCLKNIGIEIYK